MSKTPHIKTTPPPVLNNVKQINIDTLPKVGRLILMGKPVEALNREELIVCCRILVGRLKQLEDPAYSEGKVIQA